MKSILKYLEDDDCIFKYDKKLNEFIEPLSAWSFFTLFYSAIYVIIKILGFLFGTILFHNLISKAKEEKDYSEKLSEILKDDIKCFLIKDKTPNAFNAGGKTCYMTTTLYEMLNERERISIFLHEYGHYKYDHMIKLFGVETTFGILSICVLNFIFLILDPVFVKLTLIWAFIFGKIFGNKFSRIQEFDADTFSAQYGYQKELVSSLKKMENWVRVKICKNLKKEECDNVIKALSANSTHPSFKERFLNILKTPTMKNFITAMAFKPTENLLETIKRYLKKNVFSEKEVLK